MNEERATPVQVSMAKRNSCEIAANIARDARAILGGMGITASTVFMRHIMNLESVLTYEGTHDVHCLLQAWILPGLML
jgi:glutaryl-CoA dehydrogenase